jgi:hypothetical protein
MYFIRSLEMYHYQIGSGFHPLSSQVMYTATIPSTTIRCYNIHTDGWTIPVEKNTMILSWNRRTGTTQYLGGSELGSPHSRDIRIVLFDYVDPIYCKFTVSRGSIAPQHIFTKADQLIVHLDDRYSYVIRSTERMDAHSL